MTMVVIYVSKGISCDGMYEYNKIPMGNAAPYMACDVSVQSKGLNAEAHGHYKYRGLKKRIILIIKPNQSIRAFLKNRCLVRMQQIQINGSAQFRISQSTSLCLHSLNFLCRRISMNFCGVFFTKLKL